MKKGWPPVGVWAGFYLSRLRLAFPALVAAAVSLLPRHMILLAPPWLTDYLASRLLCPVTECRLVAWGRFSVHCVEPVSVGRQLVVAVHETTGTRYYAYRRVTVVNGVPTELLRGFDITPADGIRTRAKTDRWATYYWQRHSTQADATQRITQGLSHARRFASIFETGRAR